MPVSNTTRRPKTTTWWAESTSFFGPLFWQPVEGAVFTRGSVTIHHGDALQQYEKWPPPIVIISDGAYGLGLFPGDPCDPETLPDWYEPHVRM